MRMRTHLAADGALARRVVLPARVRGHVAPQVVHAEEAAVGANRTPVLRLVLPPATEHVTGQVTSCWKTKLLSP